jgi:hypothetical protein
MVAIGHFQAVRRDKMLARHFVHRPQHGLVANPALAQG